ncbi:hypothetical protein HAX54_016928, partial [Datura stramonium]|nr:hypothetical protein [Datura stramonium]
MKPLNGGPSTRPLTLSPTSTNGIASPDEVQPQATYGTVVFLPKLPMHYHRWDYIKQMLGLIGTPLALDYASNTRTRPNMAKKIEYESIPKYYKHCQLLGHSIAQCRVLKKKNKVENAKAEDLNKEEEQDKIQKDVESETPVNLLMGRKEETEGEERNEQEDNSEKLDLSEEDDKSYDESSKLDDETTRSLIYVVTAHKEPENINCAT